MQMTKKVLSLILAFVMVLGLVPNAAIATEPELVYISVSYDGQYIADKNGGYIAYVGIPLADIAAVDLDEYGLSDYLYDADGDGAYETTALQFVIYAHENLYGGSWRDVTFTGSPGSSYFQGGIFGFDENLNYYLNGEYPLAGEGWGATSDQIVLEAGDYLDLASFSSWDFYMDSNYGFHYFLSDDYEITHAYQTEEGEETYIALGRSGGFAGETTMVEATDCAVYYGTSMGSTVGSVTTDFFGEATLPALSAGKWYLWCDGGYGAEFPQSIVSAPGYAVLTVTGEDAPQEPTEPDVKNGIILENGLYYYYVDGEIQYAAGLVEVNGDYYYIRSGGFAATGAYWCTNTNGITQEGLYTFGEDGKMIDEPVMDGVIKNGIVAEGDDLYYYVNGVIQYGAGLVEIDGNFYYIRSNGQAVTGEYYITNTNGLKEAGFYTFGDDGILVEFNGIVEIDSILYYYVNGTVQYGAGLIEIDGDYYYVRSNGACAIGAYWVTNTNGLMEAGLYTFGADGKMVVE